jgi:glycosyltransferase involved in cell wall biosynthesis
LKKIMHFVPTSEANGLEHVVMDICNLVDGYDHFYVSPSGEIDSYLKDRDIDHIIVDKISPMSVKKVIKDYQPDIVNGHDVKASLSIAMNHSLCVKNNIKAISILHNDDLRMHHIGLRSLLYKCSTKSYDKIVCVSNETLNNYIFKNKIENKSTVIRNIVNPSIRSNIKSTNKHYDCIFIGRFEYQKNPQLFVKLISEIKKYVPNVKAIMLGQGSLKNEIMDYINKYDLKQNIKVAGFQKNPYEYMTDSKITVMTSRYEGLPLVALESLVLGNPVVATNVSGLDKVITNDYGYISNDINELAFNIIDMINNDMLYAKKALNALDASKQLNNVDEFIKSYKEIF